MSKGRAFRVPRIVGKLYCQRIVGFAFAVMMLHAWRALGDGVVSEPTESALRAAIEAVEPGGTVRLEFDGDVILSNSIVVTGELTIDGTGRTVSFSGANQHRIFEVQTSGSLTLRNLTLTSGFSTNGGALFNDRGVVKIADCKFVNNRARGTNGIVPNPGGIGGGGAIYNAGDLWINHSIFTSNTASGGHGYDAMYAGGPGGGSQGGAVCNMGRLWIADSSFGANVVAGGQGGNGSGTSTDSGGRGGPARGGAVFNTGQVNIVSSTFASNMVIGGQGGDGDVFTMPTGGGGTGPGGGAEGGALHNSGSLSLTNCYFDSNSSSGGEPGTGHYGTTGASALGGAVYNSGVLVGRSNVVKLSQANAGRGGGLKHVVDGNAFGGGIFNTGTVTIAGALISSNICRYGQAAGGGIYNAGGSFRLSSAGLSSNYAWSGTAGDGYYGGDGFDALGGAVFNGAVAEFSNCSFLSNFVVGGPVIFGSYSYVGTSGRGLGGGVSTTGDCQIFACTFLGNSARGADGLFGRTSWGSVATGGGAGYGGGVAATAGKLITINSTFFECTSLGGEGASVPKTEAWGNGGAGGFALGGAIFLTNCAAGVTNCTIVGNVTVPGLGGVGMTNGQPGAIGFASGGGIIVLGTSSLQLQNTIVTSNTVGNVNGGYSGGQNLLDIDARLGPLTKNEQGTIFLPLLPFSPAIDAALPVAGIDVDQRGVDRPFGSAPDIGAYEWTDPRVYKLSAPSFHTPTGMFLKGTGPANHAFRVQVSTDLAHWTDAATNSTGPDGILAISLPLDSPAKMRFYRVVSPVEE